MEVIARIRVNKINGQRVITIPKQKETEDWKEGQLVEVKIAKIK